MVDWPTSLGFFIRVYKTNFYHGAKIEKVSKTLKKGIKTKNKAQPLPNPVSSDGFITDEDSEPTLVDAMSAISTLATQVVVNEERLASQPQPGASSFRVNVPTTSTRGPGNDPEQMPPPTPERDLLP